MAGLLIRDARLVPVGSGDAASSSPVDVLVQDGVVSAVGTTLPDTGVEEIRAEGRWLSPGLWDQHVHLGQWTLTAGRLDLSAASSPEEAVRRVEAQLAARPGRHVVAFGHRSAVWERPATVAELDRVAPDVPVVLISGDAHHAWLNTLALDALGLERRDGVVSENEWFEAYPRLESITGGGDLSPTAYRAILDAAAAKGVVGLCDFEFGAPLESWPDRWGAGADVVRVRVAAYVLDSVLLAGYRTGDPLPGCDGLVTMGSLKIISDGALNTRTAWCCSPYADSEGSQHPAGLPNLSDVELLALLRTAQQNHLTVATHAIGDAALSAALDAYAKSEARGSIEHAQLASRDDVRRMAELGLRASVQPAHLIDDRDVTEQCWSDRTDRCFPFRWMVDEGVDLVLGSDAPVAPLDPWLAMAAAVHRSGDDRPAWHPEHALTAREALAASTDGWGTVAIGHPGDLVLLDHDPLAAHGSTLEVADHLRGTHVALTTVAGRVVHRSL